MEEISQKQAEKKFEYYQKNQLIFLKEAEELFGAKTDYHHGKLSYDNNGPFVRMNEDSIMEQTKTFDIYLNGKGASENITDGIFQLSHEMVHMLSPVEQDEGNETNFLEEGMAVYFSKMITERETGDLKFCGQAINKREKYRIAYELYLKLHQIDPEAVKKLRKITPVISNIKPDDFNACAIKADDQLISDLLAVF